MGKKSKKAKKATQTYSALLWHKTYIKRIRSTSQVMAALLLGLR